MGRGLKQGRSNLSSCHQRRAPIDVSSRRRNYERRRHSKESTGAEGWDKSINDALYKKTYSIQWLKIDESSVIPPNSESSI
jgi:hypothetical protein